MSKENVETAMRVDALMRAGDVEGALDYFHPDVAWRIIDTQPPMRAGRGVDSLRRLLTPGEDALFDVILPPTEAEEYIDAGNYVITVFSVPLLDDGEASIYEFEGGKSIRSIDGYPSKAEALKAV